MVTDFIVPLMLAITFLILEARERKRRERLIDGLKRFEEEKEKLDILIVCGQIREAIEVHERASGEKPKSIVVGTDVAEMLGAEQGQHFIGLIYEIPVYCYWQEAAV